MMAWRLSAAVHCSRSAAWAVTWPRRPAGDSALMSFGLAGGLDPTLDPGTVVLPSEVISRDGARFPTSPEWRRQLSLAVAEMTRVVSGTLLTSLRPIDTAEL